MASPLIFQAFICFSIIFLDASGYGSTVEHNETLFRSWSKNLQINRVDPMTIIRYDNKGEHVMGVSDDKCDNARVNLATDFDPFNQTLIDACSKCSEASTFAPDNSLDSVLTIMRVPKRYVPIHKCMNIIIRYMEHIPTIGPHRPLWARYGEYTYCPTQRWLHNIEHGAIVGLYHPCADPTQILQLKSIIKGCLFRHVITPYANLTRERPIALVGWSASLEMSEFDHDLSKNFIKYFARTGPEHVFRDGQYHKLLIGKANHVTNVIDEIVCPTEEECRSERFECGKSEKNNYEE